MRKNLTQTQFKRAIEQTTSMRAAASYLEIPYRTFIERAKKYGLYQPNQGRVGQKKTVRQQEAIDNRTVPLEEVLAGKHPTYDARTLKPRLIRAGILAERCDECNIPAKWNNKPLKLQLDHIDGNRYNHTLTNLRLLCPNCHTQTETWGGKNKVKVQLRDQDIRNALEETTSIKKVLVLLNASLCAANYNKVKKIRMELLG